MKAKNEIGLVLKNELEKINIPVDDIVWLQIEAKLKKEIKRSD